MKKILAAAALLVTISASAQDYPLKSRPKPLTATLVGVCEHRTPKLMVAIFTFENGKVLTVDGKNMEGFESAQDISVYAATAGSLKTYLQTCGDAEV